ncbi:hypothetical protein LPP1_g25 [Leptolyngbya phage LPP-1]|uniref:Uncharacterized protein n=1 Tax=Leptolyngbya phage LPP-1 TaxID=2996049 RepID=A0AAE9THR0_9CAUD|nr:hypothetical protein LPP1_g25 [Leptolyngbya phage LPP-1]
MIETTIRLYATDYEAIYANDMWWVENRITDKLDATKVGVMYKWKMSAYKGKMYVSYNCLVTAIYTFKLLGGAETWHCQSSAALDKALLNEHIPTDELENQLEAAEKQVEVLRAANKAAWCARTALEERVSKAEIEVENLREANEIAAENIIELNRKCESRAKRVDYLSDQVLSQRQTIVALEAEKFALIEGANVWVTRAAENLGRGLKAEQDLENIKRELENAHINYQEALKTGNYWANEYRELKDKFDAMSELSALQNGSFEEDSRRIEELKFRLSLNEMQAECDKQLIEALNNDLNTVKSKLDVANGKLETLRSVFKVGGSNEQST